MANALTLNTSVSTIVRKDNKNLKQLKRVTIHVPDMNVAQTINTAPILKSYDLVAASASSAKVFQYLCEHGQVDLITFDIANRITFSLKKPWIDSAIKRGIYFEMTYSACLGDSAGRRYFFSNASTLVRLTNGRHLVLSSGCTRDLFLRSPYDVINIGILIGLTYGQARDAVANGPLAVMDHAQERRGLANLRIESDTIAPTPMEVE